MAKRNREKTCEVCISSRPVVDRLDVHMYGPKGLLYECRRRSPIIVFDSTNGRSGTEWPMVNSIDWCDEHNEDRG